MDKNRIVDILAVWFVVFLFALPLLIFVCILESTGWVIRKIGTGKPDLKDFDNDIFVDLVLKQINEGLTKGKYDRIPLEPIGKEPRRS